MVFLFRPGTYVACQAAPATERTQILTLAPSALRFREKIALIFRATRSHARNLATFVALYKTACLVLRYWGPTPGKEGGWPVGRGGRGAPRGGVVLTDVPMPGRYDSLVAGLVGGYYVFGRQSPRTGRISSVNQQICIYVFARVVLALARMAIEPGAGLPVLSAPDTSSAIREYAWPVFAAGSWGMVMWLFRWHPTELQPSLRNSMHYLYELSDEWDGLRTLVWHNK